jgi:hypothetical protein
METLVFTVFDSAANAFLQPFVATTPEIAIREFRSIVNQPGHQFNKYPEDYTLFQVGSFNQETGILTPLTSPHPLGVAISFVDTPPSLEAS